MDGNLNKLFTLVGNNRKDDLKSIIALWLEKKNISSLEDADAFLGQLYNFAYKLNHHEKFELLYKLASYLSNDSGILEFFVPLCTDDYNFSCNFINYYNKQNEKLINDCINLLNIDKDNSYINKLRIDINNKNAFYVQEILNILTYLKDNVPFHIIDEIYNSQNKE